MWAIEIKGLKKVYQNTRTALHGVDLTVQRGDFFALLGPNGAGKSTIIGIICGLVNKTAGQVKVNKHDAGSVLAKSALGIVPQEINFSQFETCIDIVVNQGGYYGVPRAIAIERAEKYLTALGLWERRNSYSRTLSGGLKRRLMIVRALIHDPDILILDEPTAGVDIELRHSMWDFLAALNAAGKTILLTTHYLEEAERLCKNIAIIDQGRIISCAPLKEILHNLHKETLVLELVHPPDRLPVIASYPLRSIDALTIEVEIAAGKNINDLFLILDKHHIKIANIRNKYNRLEELFLSLIGNRK